MLRQVLSGGLSFFSLIVMFVSYAAIILVTLPIHEWAHGYIATKLGDPTPRMHGRLTLNPLAHLDLFGTLMLLLFGVGYAKPVPVNPRYFRNPRSGMALVALAGPVSNLIVAFLAAGICRLLAFLPLDGMAPALVWLFFTTIAEVSIYLAVFNLLPIPPLDGFHLISPLLPGKWLYYINRYRQYISLGLLLLLATDALDVPLGFVYNAIASVIFGIFGL